ncbi:ceramide-1-phosphate transfer protein [Lingula anatina]|uniref:Ceramide-1-phosphate transfer protein n=1 Tax=Lingula anatina TaxID=7574 RepID=A0A1S3I6S0_LINAN|nr:ceramide-1-phosphate transfer protein [Lingula anatina]|eukprot:XP_013393975.1 ceramide-1-phosphate transfer protein [Lingula anatina]
MSEHKKDFDLEVVLEALKSCKQDDDTISLKSYLTAYHELCRFFKLIGRIFAFVAHDLQDKIEILEHHMSLNPEPYSSVQTMIQYEVENNITKVKVRGQRPSGSRTLLRLHRALEFIIKFMKRLAESDEDEKTSHIASEVYRETLANYHPWLVQKMAVFVMYTLPSHKDLIEMMCKHEYKEVLRLLSEVTEEAEPIYDVVQEIFKENDLLQLP